MRDFLAFLTVCVLLGIAQTLYAALVVAAVALVLLGALTHPKQAVALLACAALFGLALREPVASAVALGSIGVAVVLTMRMRRRPVPLLLTDQRDTR